MAEPIFQINALKVLRKFFELNGDGVHLLLKLEIIGIHRHACFPGYVVDDGIVLIHLEKLLVRTPNTQTSVSVSSSVNSFFSIKITQNLLPGRFELKSRLEPISVAVQAISLGRLSVKELILSKVERLQPLIKPLTYNL